ncbi:MAG: cellulase family glycosylhydrolase [Candidatus Komeilibacteria bacterium]
MKRLIRIIRPEYIGAAVIVVLVALLVFIKFDRHYLVLQSHKVPANFWGITYSKKYAQSLDLDWREAYVALLDDVGVKKIRLPVYWDDVAPQSNELRFNDYDWLIEEAAKRDAQVIVALGSRLPRWPECHLPAWASKQTVTERQSSELAYIRSAIVHFQRYKNISAWQIQNEYYVTWFGECDKGAGHILQEQIDLVRSLDQRPIVLTDSGEFSLWRQVSKQADYVGTTMYRVAWNKYLGYSYGPWPAWLYQFKAALNGLSRSRVFVAELQAEPWPPAWRDIRSLTTREINASFTLRQFTTNAELARRTGFSQAYFWGAEWWYWLRLQGDDRYWRLAQELFKP